MVSFRSALLACVVLGSVGCVHARTIEVDDGEVLTRAPTPPSYAESAHRGPQGR